MMAVIRHRPILSQRSKKHHHAGAPNIIPDPLVDPEKSHRY
jgi:hypothetical protein